MAVGERRIGQPHLPTKAQKKTPLFGVAVPSLSWYTTVFLQINGFMRSRVRACQVR
jgi:hypothetical protein